MVESLPYADKGKQVDYYDSELNGFGVSVLSRFIINIAMRRKNLLP